MNKMTERQRDIIVREYLSNCYSILAQYPKDTLLNMDVTMEDLDYDYINKGTDEVICIRDEMYYSESVNRELLNGIVDKCEEWGVDIWMDIADDLSILNANTFGITPAQIACIVKNTARRAN